MRRTVVGSLHDVIRSPRSTDSLKMCGRFRLSQPQRFAEFSHTRLGGTLPLRFNIAPTQQVAAVLDVAPAEMGSVRWGLIPSWAKDAKIASSLINARGETVSIQPAFRTAFEKRRCLVPADGFYEWQKVGLGKVPHHIFMSDGEPFAFAGLWEAWRDPSDPGAEPVRTCTIITTLANALVAPIHNRMPVILPRDCYTAWLASETSAEERNAMLTPYPAEGMRAQPISPRVNDPRNDDPAIIEPVALAPTVIQRELFG